MITRRRFLIAAAGAGMGAAGLVYSRCFESSWLEVTRRAMPLPNGVWSGPPLRVLHLSDLHFSSVVPLSLIESAIVRGLAEKPDLVCITGDFVTLNDRLEESPYIAVLSRLATATPTFAILGNHDGRFYQRTHPEQHRVGTILQQAGLNLLHNRTATTSVRGRRVHVVGMGDLWNGECMPSVAFRELSAAPGEPILALCHNPDAKEHLLFWKWHALLSGHTHGGQCGLPFIGATLAPVEDKRYLGGAYRYADRWLHISRGVGNLHGVRFLCRPEVSLLDLS